METIHLHPKNNSNKIKIVAALAALTLLFIWGVDTYNTLLKSKQDVEYQWSQVEVQYHRRFDLIPNLVASVKGSMKHEKEILQSLSAARAAYGKATNPQEQIAAAANMDSTLARLMIIVENYPDLKANQPILPLMDEVAGTENRIAVERKRFNDQVRSYNTHLQTFPTKLIAAFMSLEAYPYLKASQAAAVAPVIDLSS